MRKIKTDTVVVWEDGLAFYSQRSLNEYRREKRRLLRMSKDALWQKYGRHLFYEYDRPHVSRADILREVLWYQHCAPSNFPAPWE